MRTAYRYLDPAPAAAQRIKSKRGALRQRLEARASCGEVICAAVDAQAEQMRAAGSPLRPLRPGSQF
jgi:hypothetical protein